MICLEIKKLCNEQRSWCFGKNNHKWFIYSLKRLIALQSSGILKYQVFEYKIIRKTKTYELASEIINQVQLA